MSHFDVFNGDADGLCALHQLRLARPRAAELVTGVKRDNALLARVPARGGDSVTVLDIALDGNREALLALLGRGVRVEYFDHHHPGEIPAHPGLEATIDTAPEVCTSVLVDAHLGGAHTAWAVVGAYGDNLRQTAERLAGRLGFDDVQRDLLRRLGECLNYNSYGDSREDLMYWPGDLYLALRAYEDPLAFAAAEEILPRLERQRGEDMARALAVAAAPETASAAVRLLPDAAWSRRAVGALANHLAKADGARAHALLVPNARGALTVSLRVPAGFAEGADGFARRFGGNGRKLAAGINDLPHSERDAFVAAFLAAFRRGA